MLLIPFSSRSFPEKALIAIGTSDTDSVLLLAVVTTSSMLSADSSDESWAWIVTTESNINEKIKRFSLNKIFNVIPPL